MTLDSVKNNASLLKFDKSKIWKGEPSKINREVRDAFCEWLLEKTKDGHRYANRLFQGRDINLTFEHFYRLQQDPDAEPPVFNQSSMSLEARNWGGLDRLDPCINSVRFKRGVLAGGLHTWATMPFYKITEKGKMIVNREVAVEFIKQMPVH